MRAKSAVEVPINSKLEVDGHEESACPHCKDRRGFSIPHSLIEDFAKGDVVVFAGAGVSTENREVMPWTLHEEFCAALKVDKSKTAFPDAAEQFSSQPNGRVKLLQKILERFAYVNSFSELRDEATRFHSELATLFSVAVVITTNWDTYFEEMCACQPFVLDADMAFWESAKRRVLKIHGSVENLSTVVATRSDYAGKQIDLHKSLIGSWLKTLLTTKTVVFFGYSLRDDDFLEIMSFVRTALGAFTRQHYVITTESEPAVIKRYEQYGLIPITTDGSCFLENVKAHIVDIECVNPDEVYSHAAKALKKVRAAHIQLYDKMDIYAQPEILYCASYQDGLIHNLSRIVDSRPSGAYSDLHSIQMKLLGYEERRKEKLSAKKYEDVAYIDGYAAGIFLALTHSEDPHYIPPLFYVYASDPFGTDRLIDYQRELKSVIRRKRHHKGASMRARKLVKDLAALGDKDLVFHHKCQLL